jgi:hypothetical protein
MSACCLTVSLKSSELGMDFLMDAKVVTQLPFGIVSRIAANGNIAVALICGKTVEYATISVDALGKSRLINGLFMLSEGGSPKGRF